MGILTRLFSRPQERADSKIYDPRLGPRRAWDQADSPIVLNEQKINGIAAYIQACRVIGEGIGTCPMTLMQKKGAGRKEIMDHPAAIIAKYEPSGDLSPSDFHSAAAAQAAGPGNSYVRIRRDRDGRPIVGGLEPLDPILTWPIRKNGRKYYRTSIDGKEEFVSPFNMLHLKGFKFNADVGMPLTTVFRNMLALSHGSEAFALKFFERGAHNGKYIKATQHVKSEDLKAMKETLEETMVGLNEAHGNMICPYPFEPGVLPLNLNDLSFLALREFLIEDVSRATGVPPFALFSFGKATWKNVEEQSLFLVVHCLRPWVVKWEQQWNIKMLTEEERRQGYYFHINLDALLRGDSKSRAETHQLYVDRGIKTINEIRAHEDWNPIDGGDRALIPLNMGVLSGDPLPLTLEQEQKLEIEKLKAQSSQATRDDLRKLLDQLERQEAPQPTPAPKSDFSPIFAATTERMAAIAFKQTSRALKGDDFEQEMDQFLTKHRGQVRDAFAPVCRAAGHDLDEWVDWYITRFRDDIGEILLDKYTSERVMARWESGWPTEASVRYVELQESANRNDREDTE